MKIPKTVKVGGLTYDVLYPWIFAEDDMFLGMHEVREVRIKLGGSFRGGKIPDCKVKQTLIHELFHAIDFYYVNHTLTEDDSVIDRFATGWLNILNNNKLNLSNTNFKLPKTVKIGEYVYKVIHPYEYQDICPAPQFSVDTTMQHIRFPNEQSPQMLKMNFVHALTIVINSDNCILEASILSNNGNVKGTPKETILENLSYGWFQVLIDNNIERVIRNA